MHYYLVVIEFAKKNSHWHVIYMKYSTKGENLSDPSLVSDFLKEVASLAEKKISTRMKPIMLRSRRSTAEKKNMILFASGYGTKIASEFAMAILNADHFHIKSYFGEPYNYYSYCDDDRTCLTNTRMRRRDYVTCCLYAVIFIEQ